MLTIAPAIIHKAFFFEYVEIGENLLRQIPSIRWLSSLFIIEKKGILSASPNSDQFSIKRRKY